MFLVFKRPPLGIHDKQVALKVATAILKGEDTVSWWRGGPKEDEVMVEAADIILENIGDSDMVGKVGAVTDNNMREQWTVEEIEKLQEDRKWYSWGARRN